MEYQKQTWVDGETLIHAERLNHMEEGIGQAAEGVTQLENRLDAGAAHQMLVTNGQGETVWQEQTHYCNEIEYSFSTTVRSTTSTGERTYSGGQIHFKLGERLNITIGVSSISATIKTANTKTFIISGSPVYGGALYVMLAETSDADVYEVTFYISGATSSTFVIKASYVFLDIKTLDAKYLPSDIARTEQIPSDDHINTLIDAKAELPVNAAPQQMLVTNTAGQPEWQDRTHYSELKYMQIIPEKTLTTSVYGTLSCNRTSDNISIDWNGLEDGFVYDVVINGTAYQLSPVYDSSNIAYLGNPSLYEGDANKGNGEPFALRFATPSFLILITETAGDCTISLSGHVTVYHKLSGDYTGLYVNAENGGYTTTRAGVESTGADSFAVSGGTATGESSFSACNGAGAIGANSVALNVSMAQGVGAFSTGGMSYANKDYSSVFGFGTAADGAVQHVIGRWNVSDNEIVSGSYTQYAFIVGNGTMSSRSNAHTLDWSGNAWFAGSVYVGGTGQDDTENVQKLMTEAEVLALIDQRLSELNSGTTE